MKAYQEYVALRLHFTQDKYDYFKYLGKVKTIKDSTFEARNDVFHFRRLERRYKDDLTGFYVANMSQGVRFIREMVTVEAEKRYVDWKRHMESITYRFKQDMQNVTENCKDVAKAWSTSGDHPEVLRLYLGGKLSIESLILSDRVLKFQDNWDSRISDTIIWPDVSRLMKKYGPFIKADTDVVKKTMRQVFIA